MYDWARAHRGRLTTRFRGRYSFWMTQRAVRVPDGAGGHHTLNRYDAPTVTAPRPESYGQDLELMHSARAFEPMPAVVRSENRSHRLYRHVPRRAWANEGRGGRASSPWR